jgi:hypothetical protein
MRVPRLTISWLTIGISVAGLAACAEPIQEETAPPVELPPTTVSAPPALPASPPESVKLLPARRFLMVQGTVKVDGAKAVEGVEFSETATIEASKGSRAILTLGKGSLLDLRPGTKITFGSTPRAKISVKLVLGALGSIMPEGSSYEVVGQNAVAGVRGTVFFAEVDKKKDTYICACSGDVAMQAANPKSFDQVVHSPNNDHNGFTFSTKGKKQQAKKTPRKHHGDLADAKLIFPFLDAVK